MPFKGEEENIYNEETAGAKRKKERKKGSGNTNHKTGRARRTKNAHASYLL
jgi:hypothetical protein